MASRGQSQKGGVSSGDSPTMLDGRTPFPHQSDLCVPLNSAGSIISMTHTPRLSRTIEGSRTVTQDKATLSCLSSSPQR